LKAFLALQTTISGQGGIWQPRTRMQFEFREINADYIRELHGVTFFLTPVIKRAIFSALL
jgi:hypothetical protein